MTEHCGECGSRLCNHGNCPECNPCHHCDGGDRNDKFFGYEEDDRPVQSADDLDRYVDFVGYRS